MSEIGGTFETCRPTVTMSVYRLLAEHWDVIQDEATREQSRSGLPMFGDKFPA